MWKSAGGVSSGIEAVIAASPSPTWTYGPNRPMRTTTGAAALGVLPQGDDRIVDLRLVLDEALEARPRAAVAAVERR